MQRAIWTACLIIGGTAFAMAQSDRREAGAHVHGAGTLSIAIEGNKVSMDLSAPANDILGFEHEARTPEQQQALAAAKTALAHPLQLIDIPAAAGCTVDKVNVAFNTPDAPSAGASGTGTVDTHQHADFDVDYALTCKAIDKLTSISFSYFKPFPGAQKLTVTLVTESGQSEFEVTRQNPQISLK